MRSLFRSLIMLAFALGCSCREDPTYALIEVESDLGAQLTRVEVVVRDDRDREMIDRYSFDGEAEPKYRLPFSFVLEPRARADQAVIVTATGYGSSELLSETKGRVTLARGQITRLVLQLSAACRGVPACAPGQACDPARAECGAVPDASNMRGDSVRVRTGVAGKSEQAGAQAGAEEAGAGGSIEMGPEGGKANGGHAATGPAGHAGDGAGGHSGAAAGGGTGGAGRAAAGSGGAAAGGGTGGAGGAGGAGAGAGAGGAAGMDGAGGRLGVPGGVGSGEQSGSAMADVSYQGQGYVVASNVYGPGAQTLQYEGTSFRIANQTGDAPNGVAFFAVFVGSQFNKASAGTNLPLRADAVESIEVSMMTNAGTVPGTYQALSALWFSAGSAADSSLPTGGYLEVWHYVQTPHNPPGNRVASALGLSGVPGKYDVWQGSCSGRPCTTYVRTDALANYTGDLVPFLRDALARPDGIQASWYLSAVYCGFDVAAGGVGLTATAITEHVR